MTPKKQTPTVGEAIAKALADGTATEQKRVNLGDFLEDDVPPPGGDWSEREFQQRVYDLAKSLGWTVVWWRPARVIRGGREVYETPVGGDGRGYPDMEFHRDRHFKAELKVGRNKRTPAQDEWAGVCERSGTEYHLWYPSQWDEIVKTLK